VRHHWRESERGQNGHTVSRGKKAKAAKGHWSMLADAIQARKSAVFQQTKSDVSARTTNEFRIHRILLRAITMPLDTVGHNVSTAAMQSVRHQKSQMMLGGTAATPVDSPNEQKVGLLQKKKWTRHQDFELRNDARQERLAATCIRHNRFVHNSHDWGNGEGGEDCSARLNHHAQGHGRPVMRWRSVLRLHRRTQLCCNICVQRKSTRYPKEASQMQRGLKLGAWRFPAVLASMAGMWDDWTTPARTRNVMMRNGDVTTLQAIPASFSVVFLASGSRWGATTDVGGTHSSSHTFLTIFCFVFCFFCVGWGCGPASGRWTVSRKR